MAGDVIPFAPGWLPPSSSSTRQTPRAVVPHGDGKHVCDGLDLDDIRAETVVHR